MRKLTNIIRHTRARSRAAGKAALRRTAYLLPLLLALMPHAAFAQSAAEWSQIKSNCNLPSSTVYNDWVAQGCPCNKTAGSTANNPPATATPAGLTPEQQLGTQLGMMGANMIGQGLRQLLSGPAPARVDPAQQQRLLAAQQLNNSGVYLFKQKNYSGAINLFQQALANSPNDKVIAANLTLAKQRLDQSIRNAAAATQTSHTLAQLLSSPAAAATPSPTNLPAPAINSVDLDSDSRVVDLRGTTKTSVDPALLKNGMGKPGETQEQQQQELNEQFDKAINESEGDAQSDRAQLDADFDKLSGQAPATSATPPQPEKTGDAPNQPGSADDSAHREAIAQQRAALHSKLTALNARCASIEPDSPEEASCKSDQAALLIALARIHE